MDKENWDGADYRRSMGRRAEAHDDYIKQHRDRLRCGQQNGSEMVHDRWKGEWWVYYRLAGITATDTPETLIAELRRMAVSIPTFDGAFDQEIAASGYLTAIRGELHQLGEDMPHE